MKNKKLEIFDFANEHNLELVRIMTESDLKRTKGV
jgi:hypothetical protein